MNEHENVLHVGNLQQKIIFLCEMQGQLSDGMWENTRPHDHWRIWCNLDWDTVKVTPDNHGRNFYPPKDNYNFANKDLLDIVGERLRVKINLVNRLGEPVLDLLKTNHWAIPDDIRSFKLMVLEAMRGEKYYIDKKARLDKVGITLEAFGFAVVDDWYTTKDLTRDCKLLKISCRSQIA